MSWRSLYCKRHGVVFFHQLQGLPTSLYSHELTHLQDCCPNCSASSRRTQAAGILRLLHQGYVDPYRTRSQRHYHLRQSRRVDTFLVDLGSQVASTRSVSGCVCRVSWCGGSHLVPNPSAKSRWSYYFRSRRNRSCTWDMRDASCQVTAAQSRSM